MRANPRARIRAAQWPQPRKQSRTARSGTARGGRHAGFGRPSKRAALRVQPGSAGPRRHSLRPVSARPLHCFDHLGLKLLEWEITNSLVNANKVRPRRDRCARLDRYRPQAAAEAVALDCCPHLTGHRERDPPRLVGSVRGKELYSHRPRPGPSPRATQQDERRAAVNTLRSRAASGDCLLRGGHCLRVSYSPRVQLSRQPNPPAATARL